MQGSLSYLAYFPRFEEDKVAITGYGGNRASILPHLKGCKKEWVFLILSTITSVKTKEYYVCRKMVR